METEKSSMYLPISFLSAEKVTDSEDKPGDYTVSCIWKVAKIFSKIFKDINFKMHKQKTSGY